MKYLFSMCIALLLAVSVQAQEISIKTSLTQESNLNQAVLQVGANNLPIKGNIGYAGINNVSPNFLLGAGLEQDVLNLFGVDLIIDANVNYLGGKRKTSDRTIIKPNEESYYTSGFDYSGGIAIGYKAFSLGTSYHFYRGKESTHYWSPINASFRF